MIDAPTIPEMIVLNWLSVVSVAGSDELTPYGADLYVCD